MIHFNRFHNLMRYFYDQLEDNKFYNLEEMDKLLHIFNLPRLNHKKVENLGNPKAVR